MTNREQTYFTQQTEMNPEDKPVNIGGPVITSRICDRRLTPKELEEFELRFADYILKEQEKEYYYHSNQIESE
jgi:hypothetical protein